MPTPDRTSIEQIVRAGREILESAGVAGLTMQAVADRVGVRAPSLYKRVRNRDDLVRLITEATVRDLADRLAAVDLGTDARRDLGELARTLRAFASAHPTGYQLVFAPYGGAVSREAIEHAVQPVLRVVTALAGTRYALEAARTVTAWAHGFITMELAGAFQLGGDVEGAFEFGIARLADALAATPALRPVTERGLRRAP